MAHEREIGGHRWTVEPFTGRESLSLFRVLMALAGEPLAKAVQEASEKIADDQELSAAVVLTAAGGAAALFGRVAEKLSDAELEKLSMRLLAQTLCDGRGVAPAFDVTFKGDVALLLRVIAFVVEVNFWGPFASWLGPAVSSALQGLTQRLDPSTPGTSSATNPTR